MIEDFNMLKKTIEEEATQVLWVWDCVCSFPLTTSMLSCVHVNVQSSVFLTV